MSTKIFRMQEKHDIECSVPDKGHQRPKSCKIIRNEISKVSVITIKFMISVIIDTIRNDSRCNLNEYHRELFTYEGNTSELMIVTSLQVRGYFSFISIFVFDCFFFFFYFCFFYFYFFIFVFIFISFYFDTLFLLAQRFSFWLPNALILKQRWIQRRGRGEQQRKKVNKMK